MSPETSAPAPGGGAAANAPARARLPRVRELALLGVVIAGAVALHLASHGAFLTRANLAVLALGMSFDAIIVVGMTVLLVAGGFDLSVGSVLGVSAAMAALTARALADSGLAPLAGLGVGLVAGLGVGAINGLVVSRVGVNALIATLATMSMGRGLVSVLTGGSEVANLPASFAALGQTSWLGLQSPVWVMAVVVVLGDVCLRKSRFLRRAYYVGGNEESARLSGINVANVKLFCFVLTAVLVGLAGVLSAARHGSANVSTGLGTELRVIAAAVVGGASLSGGEGTVAGALLGVLLMQLITHALNLLGAPPEWHNLASGAVLLAAATVDIVTRRRRT